jgi:Phage integrase, N-terminal SAM-like domain
MGEIRQRGKVWWIRYYSADGRRQEESTRSTVKQKAIDLLKIREGDGAHGMPVTAKINRFRFDDAAADLLMEYRINDRVSINVLERRLRKHLRPFFGGRRMATITTTDIRKYIAHRQQVGIVAAKGRRTGHRIGDVSNAEINRELATMKRMFTLAIQADKLLRRPQRDAAVRKAVLFLLDTLVENGSSAAFRMRDDFVTPASA